jgi:hypothetical protein
MGQHFNSKININKAVKEVKGSQIQFTRNISGQILLCLILWVLLTLYGFSYSVPIVGRATLKMLHRKSKTQFVNQERNTQNAIPRFNYLKRIAPQQLMLRMQVFTK